MKEINDNIDVLRLSNLAIGYKQKNGQKIVARNINATLRRGELTALLGSNGIGKSTLLRTLTRKQPALEGEIAFNDKPLLSYSGEELSKQISIVLTERIELKNTTVFEVIAMGRAPYTGFWGTLCDEDRRIVNEAIELIKIDHLRSRLIDSLSDGERQKVMIAKALTQQTPIIILDEPTAFLDFPSKVDMMQILHRLTRELGKTVLLSTHDLDLALQIADRIWLLDTNNKLHIGIPEDLSLDGTLSNFFERKGIVFDRDNGLFRIENTPDRKLKMRGHGHRYAMVRKAMLRNGIAANAFVEHSESDMPFELEVNKEQILLHHSDGKTVEVNKIEELLEYI